MDESVATQLLTVLAASAVGVALCQRLGLSPILGYLAAGAILGPSFGGLGPDGTTTRLLAELGVVLLMFTVGLEFSLPRLIAAKRLVLGLGAAQMGLTAPLFALGAWWLGANPAAAWVLGIALALSSTAIALKQLGEQMELSTTHGRAATGVLLFQDLAAVAFLAALPVLGGATALPDAAAGLVAGWLPQAAEERVALDAAGSAGSLVWGMLVVLSAAVTVFAALTVVGRRLLPPILGWVAQTRSLELFMLVSLVLALAAAGASGVAGLSPTLGAFMAGLLLGETPFRHQIEADLQPFRDLMLGIFFVSVGMQLDLAGPLAFPGLALAALAATVAAKAAILGGLLRAFGQTWEDAWRAALCLAQGGELGLLLVASASADGLLSPVLAQPVLGGLVFSMMLGSPLLRYNGPLARMLARGRFRGTAADDLEAQIDAASIGLADHVIVCGYGRVGQNLLGILAQEGIAALALDLDPERVRQGTAAGGRVFFGNASQPGILRAAGIERARAVVVTVDDVGLALGIVGHLRALWPSLPVLVRSVRGRNDRALIAAGVEVFPEGLESSLSLAGQVLILLGVSPSRVESRLNAIRAQDYAPLRVFIHDSCESSADARDYPEQVRAVVVAEGQHAAGRTPEELGLPALGVALVDVRRGAIRVPGALLDTRLRAGDVVVLNGTLAAIDRAAARLAEGG